VHLLVTRPDPDGERTAAALRERGHDVTVAPLLRLEHVDFELPNDAVGAVVLTSANAASAVAHHSRRAALTALPAFTVGRHTAQAARLAGFETIHCAEGDKVDLVDLVIASYANKPQPLLYLAGEDRTGDIAADLAPHGLTVRTAAVYRAVKLDRFPAHVEELLAGGALDGVLHFSKRSAEAYIDCATRAGMLARALEPLHFCLSRQVAAALAGAGATTKVAPRPEEAALIDLVALPQVS
jgi:uroporphyrinogen-III synthase